MYFCEKLFEMIYHKTIKKIFFLTALGISGFLFSQVEESEEKLPFNPQQATNIQKLKETEGMMPPIFPTGFIGFRQNIMKLFKLENLPEKDEGDFQCLLKLTIDKEGNISNITATGNNKYLNKEAERVIKLIKTKWQPATKDGEPIEYKIGIPFSLSF